MDILRDLENIINNPENKKWKNIEVLIDFYKKKLEEQRTTGMQIMALMFGIKPVHLDLCNPLSILKDGKEKAEKPQAILIRCILEGEEINIETCKKCQNQCVNYKGLKIQT